MELECIDFRGTCHLIEEKKIELARIDLNIDTQLLDLERSDPSDDKRISGIYKSIESLRFSRNNARSQLQDAQSWQKTLKRRHFESMLMDEMLKNDPVLFSRISSRIQYEEGSRNIEIEILSQQRRHTYRKIQETFSDMVLISSSVSTATATKKESIERRLSRSRRFFSRQCMTIRSIRDDIYSLSTMDYSHLFYLEAVSQMGKEAVDDYAEVICSKKAA